MVYRGGWGVVSHFLNFFCFMEFKGTSETKPCEFSKNIIINTSLKKCVTIHTPHHPPPYPPPINNETTAFCMAKCFVMTSDVKVDIASFRKNFSLL